MPKRNKRKRPSRGSGRRAGQRFDAQFGVTTEATVFLGELDPEMLGASIEHATHYDPTPIADFERLLEATTIGPERAVFVDLGCGMGRVVLLAARRPFRQVIGVDFSPALCTIARDNLARFGADPLRCRDVRIVSADAREYRLPRGPAVVYLFNPFGGPVFDEVVARLAAHGDELNVIYHTPLRRKALDDHPSFQVVIDFPWGVVYRNRRKAGRAPATDSAPAGRQRSTARS